MTDTRGVVRLGMPPNQRPDENSLKQFLVKYCQYWRSIGLELGLPSSLLSQVELQYDSLTKRFQVILNKWLLMDDGVTWGKLELAITNANRVNLALRTLTRIPTRQGDDHESHNNNNVEEQQANNNTTGNLQNQDGDDDVDNDEQGAQDEIVKPEFLKNLNQQSVEDTSQPHKTKEQQDLDKFLKNAIKNKETIMFKHVKVFLSGSSAAGKTNLRYSLLGQKFKEEYESTDIQETKHAYIASNAGILESKEGDKIWSEFDLKEQLSHFKSLWEYQLEKKSKKNLEQNIVDASSDDSEDEGLLEITEKLSESENMPKNIKIQEPVKLVSMIDTGGQPGYIHMLPAIIHMLPDSNNCPTVNLVVIDMTKSLEDNVLVRYRKKGQKEETKPYHLHYTNKDLIKLLLSVTTDSFNVKEVVAPKPDVHIGFIGTHKDILKKDNHTRKILILDDQLSELIIQQNCQDKIIKSIDRKYLFPVSNKASKDAAVIKLKIEDVLNDVEPMPLPIKWMILELAVKLHCASEKVPYITYQRFKGIATDQASINEEEAKEALYYFHSRGIFLNFQEVDKMSDYVIVEHQWLFDQLSMLVTVSSENPACDDHGIIMKSKLPKREIDEGIKMENLISLLDKKKILASYTKNSETHYYLPYVLPYCQQYADKFKFLLLEPLLVRFSSGFLPRGFFCSLVVHFLQNIPDGWIPLHEDTNKHFRNIMTFQLPNNIYLRLQDKIYYLEIQVRHYQHHKEESMLKELETICKYLYEVCKTMKFDYRKLQFGFLCQHAKWDEESHMGALLKPLSYNSGIVKIKLCDNRIHCKKCQNTTDMGDLHKLWFKEIKESNGVTAATRIPCVEGAVVIDQITDKDSTPTPRDLNRYVTNKYADDWRSIGLELGLEYAVLHIISKDHQQDSITRFEKTLDKWLTSNPHGTWRTLEVAITNAKRSGLGLNPVDNIYV